MSAPPPVAEIVRSFLEPIYWSSFVAVGLVGCSLSQAIHWAGSSYHSDPLWIKLFIFTLLSLNIAKSACDVHGLHNVLLDNFGTLSAVPKTFHAALILTVCIVFLCQSWQFYRLVIVSRRNPVVMIVGGLLLASSLASSALYIVGTRKSHNISQTAVILHLWYPITSWLKFATDLFMSGAFTFFVLREHRKALNVRLGFILRRVAVTTLQAFFPCTLLALATAVVGQTSPESTLFGALAIVLAPLYAVSVLFTLNSREAIRREGDRIPDEVCYPTEFCSIAVLPPTSAAQSVNNLAHDDAQPTTSQARKGSFQNSIASY